MKINLLNVAKITTVKIFLDIKVYTECKTWFIDHRKLLSPHRVMFLSNPTYRQTELITDTMFNA